MTVFLTTADLAARWRLSPGHVENLRSAGGGPVFVKLGTGRKSPVRYRLSDVEAWERGQNRAELRDPSVTRPIQPPAAPPS